MSLSDRERVLGAARGDLDSFTKLVQEYSNLVYRVALRIVGPESAQDASQEVWVRVWQNIKAFRGDSAFSTWLYKITVNTCLNAKKQEARRVLRESAAEVPYLPEPPSDEYDPEAQALGEERREELMRALAHVRPDHRAAVVLRHMEDLPYTEIAEILEVPDGTAKVWASRGRAALLIALANSDGDDLDGAAPNHDGNGGGS